MTVAPEISSKHLINILNFQKELRELWQQDEQRPVIYSHEQFRKFWDIHVPEPRK